MMILFAYAIACSIGILTLRFILKGRFPFYLGLFLGAALGLGISSQIIFYLQILGGHFNHFLPPLLSLMLLGILIVLNKSIQAPKLKIPRNLSLLILFLLAIPLWLEAHYYPMGGWDAWSCWNLKAKFIYLGAEHWKDMLESGFWRSNTNYPLALPAINVWFWQWSGFSETVPMINAVVFTLLTAGILLLGLQEFNVTQRISIIIVLAVFTLGFGNTLSISQYSDMLFSLYLLCAFICYLFYHQNKNYGWLVLTALFTGLLSFTKNEGLVAAGVLSVLVLYFKPHKPLVFIGALLTAAFPEIIFALFIAPHNEAFINGLASSQKPSDLSRLQHVLSYPVFELIGLQWSGLWILAIGAIIAAQKQAFEKPLLTIGLFMAFYLAIVLAYYQVNTFFEIGWWMSNTLNRILFALMPSVFLWMGLSVFAVRKDA